MGVRNVGSPDCGMPNISLGVIPKAAYSFSNVLSVVFVWPRASEPKCLGLIPQSSDAVLRDMFCSRHIRNMKLDILSMNMKVPPSVLSIQKL